MAGESKRNFLKGKFRETGETRNSLAALIYFLLRREIMLRSYVANQDSLEGGHGCRQVMAACERYWWWNGKQAQAVI